MDKRGVIEFSWIFSVIVGAIILFLAFYFVGTNLLSQRYQQSTIAAQSLDIILNPFAQFGEVKEMSQAPLALEQLSTINISCDYKAQGMGYNDITIATKGEQGIPRIVYDKYIYAEQSLETKKFQALSMPFEIPWRVADIMILWPYDKKYCFMNAPAFIEDALGNSTSTGLNISSIHFSSCPAGSIKVCFGSGSGCDIKVEGAANHQGKTTKAGKSVFFAGDALMYASIFSEREIYNCNLRRLSSRITGQAQIYEEKARALSGKGCSTAFNLAPLKTAADTVSGSTPPTDGQLNTLWQTSQNIKSQNNVADCNLF